MRATTLLSILLLLAGCSKAPPPPKTLGNLQLFEPDSPIKVTDGSSIHFEKDDGIDYSDPAHKHVIVHIDPYQPIELRVYGCTGPTLPAGCTGHYLPLGKGTTPWHVTLHHTDGTGTNVTKIDYPGSGSYVDIIIPPSVPTTFSQDPFDPTHHVYQPTHHLAYAMANGQKLGCPSAPPGTPPGGTRCEMAIVPTH